MLFRWERSVEYHRLMPSTGVHSGVASADLGIGCNLSQRSEMAHILFDERDADLALCAPHYTAIEALLLFSSNREHEFVRHVLSGRHHEPSAMVRHVPDHAKVLTATGALN